MCLALVEISFRSRNDIWDWLLGYGVRKGILFQILTARLDLIIHIPLHLIHVLPHVLRSELQFLVLCFHLIPLALAWDRSPVRVLLDCLKVASPEEREGSGSILCVRVRAVGISLRGGEVLRIFKINAVSDTVLGSSTTRTLEVLLDRPRATTEHIQLSSRARARTRGR